MSHEQKPKVCEEALLFPDNPVVFCAEANIDPQLGIQFADSAHEIFYLGTRAQKLEVVKVRGRGAFHDALLDAARWRAVPAEGCGRAHTLRLLFAGREFDEALRTATKQRLAEQAKASATADSSANKAVAAARPGLTELTPDQALYHAFVTNAAIELIVRDREKGTEGHLILNLAYGAHS